MLSLTSFACASQGKSFSINAWRGFVNDSVKWSWYLFRCCRRGNRARTRVSGSETGAHDAKFRLSVTLDPACQGASPGAAHVKQSLGLKNKG